MGNNVSSDRLDIQLNDAAEGGDEQRVAELLKKGANPNRLIRIFPSDEKVDDVKRDSLILRNNNNKPAIDSDIEGKEGRKLRHDSGNESSPGDKSGDDGIYDNVFYNRNSLKRRQDRTAELTAFHRASRTKDNVAIVKKLLPHVINLDVQDSNGDTALHHCVRLRNNRKMLLAILSLKPNIDAQNDNGETPLHSVVNQGCDARIVETLLLFGADPNICDNRGDTPLHICARRRGIDPMIPGMLLRFGCNPNTKNNLGQTTLHVAASCGNRTVLLLLKFNAKVRLRDNEGRLPSDVASSEEVKLILLAEEEELFNRKTQSTGSGPSWVSPSPRTGSSLSRESSLESSHQRSTNSELIEMTDSAPQYSSTPANYTDESDVSPPHRSPPTRLLTHPFDRQMQTAGGDGVIYLPGKAELVIPPDSIPTGTSVTMTLEPNDRDVPHFDFSKFDFNLDIKLVLPNGVLLLPYSSLSSSNTMTGPPIHIGNEAPLTAFSGLVMEGDTAWRSERELACLENGKTALGFKLEKKKCVPLRMKEHVKSAIEVELEKSARERFDENEGNDDEASSAALSNYVSSARTDQSESEDGVENPKYNMDAVTSDEEEGGRISRKRSQESIDYTDIDTTSIMLARQVMVVSTSDHSLNAEDSLDEDDRDSKYTHEGLALHDIEEVEASEKEIEGPEEDFDANNERDEFDEEYKEEITSFLADDIDLNTSNNSNNVQFDDEEEDVQSDHEDSFNFIHEIQQPESINERIQHPIDLELATIPEEGHPQVQIPEFNDVTET